MKAPCRLSWGLAFVMAGQSLTGLIFQTQYRDADWIRAAWFANDWVTIAVAVPLLVAGRVRAAAGSSRGTLLWLSAAAYAVYNYALVLSAGSLVAVRRGLVPSPGEVPIRATLAVATTIMTVLLLREIRGDNGSGDCRDGARELH